MIKWEIGKPQALNAWLKEFIYNVLIQPFHCILYLAFGNVALSLITSDTGATNLATAVLAILCIQFIKKGEEIVKKIFGFDNASSMGTLKDAASTAAAVTDKGKSLGSAAGKAVGNASQKLMKASKNAAGKIKEAKETRSNNKAAQIAALRDKKDKTKKEQKKVDKYDKKEQKKNPTMGQRAQKKQDREKKKIENQMIKNMGAEAFADMMAKGGKNHPDYQEQFNKAKDDLVKKQEHRKEIRGKVGNALGKVGKTVYTASAGYAKLIGPMIGLFAGMAYGNTSAWNGMRFGQGAVEGFLSATNKTAEKNIADNVGLHNNIGINVDDAYVSTVKDLGDGGAYDNKEIAQQIKKLIQTLGDLKMKNAEQNVARLNHGINTNSLTTDSIQQMIEASGLKGEKADEAMGAIMEFSKFRADANLYKDMVTGNQTGMGMQGMLETIRETNNSTTSEEHTYHYEREETKEKPSSDDVPTPSNEDSDGNEEDLNAEIDKAKSDIDEMTNKAKQEINEEVQELAKMLNTFDTNGSVDA